MLDYFFISLIWTVGLVIAGFTFWRRQEKDIPDAQLWPMIYKSLFWSLITGRLIWWFWQQSFPTPNLPRLWQLFNYPGFDILGGLLGVVLFIHFSKNFKRNLASEIGDHLIEAYLLAVTFIAISHWLRHHDGSWPYKSSIIFSLLLWYWVKHHYRSWTWYPSGKVGFLWWTGITLLSFTELTNLYLSSPWFHPINLLLRNLYILFPILTGIMQIYKLSGRSHSVDQQKIMHQFKTWLAVIKPPKPIHQTFFKK